MTQPDFFPDMPRRLSHAEILAGFAELRRVMALPDFPLQHDCSCVDHPVYGVEVDHCCPLHGDRCEHGKLADEPCAECEAPNDPSS